uniref:LOW QUALITY PROTEIN: proteinase-activated receptor 4 n=1 Tax=Podarcis muralis TaxID=64176 RepID=UPI0010A03611|nr:LOW QUALITY PROTEIN: proteinase-activated receptor 4 [Podarcis muralis]
MHLCGAGPSLPLRLLTLFLLCGQPAKAAAADDYDDYATPNGTEAPQHPPPLGLCPRAIPSARVTLNRTTFLVLPPSSQAQLDSPLTTILLPSFYALLCLVGLPANALALWVLATRIEKLPSTIFLMNLAAADLFLGLLLPFKAAYYYLGNHWPFGEGMCRLNTAAFHANMYCSLLLLACISADRYLAVAHPFLARSFRSPAVAVGTCAAAWGAAILSALPLALRCQSFPLLGTDRVLCHDALPAEDDATYFRPYFVALVAGGFVAPLLVMVLCSGATLRVLAGKGERYATAIKLTVVVVVSVVALYTPSHVLLLLHYSRRCAGARGTLYVAYMGALAASASNTCVDPFVYYYASEEFRAKVAGRIFGTRKDSAVSLKTSKETLPTKCSQTLA